MGWRTVALWAATIIATMALVVLGVLTAFWFSVGGTFFRGERVTVGTILQMGLAMMACVGLVFLVRTLIRAARRS